MVRPQFLRLQGYQPILPPEALEEQGIAGSDLIKLDGNENPYGCSPRVARALAEYPSYHIYPDPYQTRLRRALGDYTHVPYENIIAGSGSDELIELTFRLFLENGDKVISWVPTFGMYRFTAELFGGVEVPLLRDASYELDLGRLEQALDKRTKIIVVASPNNPTGNTTPMRAIERLLDTGRIVVVDEAYYEFSGITAASHVPEVDNLIVLRSFSKWAGLAGLRVGYGLFPSSVARYIDATKQPYNVNSAGLVAALESLADLDYLNGRVQAILEEREALMKGLKGLPFLKPFPSEANFILCQVVKGKASDLHKGLQKRGILIRYFDTPLLKDFIRISVGKPEHTTAILKALQEANNE